MVEQNEIKIIISAEVDEALRKLNMSQQKIRQIGEQLKNTKNGMKITSTQVAKNGDVLSDSFTIVGKKVTNMGQSFKTTKSAISQFKMEYLSLLFFGQAIQRTFQKIAMSTLSFYNQMNKGQTEAGQGLIRLSAAFQYLKFTIGEALATALLPMIPTIIDLIDWIANWASENPKLVAGIVGIGIAVGFLFSAIGFLVLGLQAVWNVFLPFFTMIKTVAVYLSGTAVGGFLLLAAAALLLIFVIKNARNAFFDLFKDLVGILKHMAGLFYDVFTGDFESAGKRMIIITLYIAKAFVDLARVITHALSGIAEAIVGLVMTPLFLLAKTIDALLNAVGKKSNLASRTGKLIDDVTKSVKNNKVVTDLDNASTFLGSQISQKETELQVIKESKVPETPTETTPQGQVINFNGDINVEANDPQELMDRLNEEFKRYSGTTGGRNL